MTWSPPKKLEILETDPFAGAADLGVGEAEVGSKAQRIGKEDQKQRRSRREEHEPEHVATLEMPAERGSEFRHLRSSNGLAGASAA